MKPPRIQDYPKLVRVKEAEYHVVFMEKLKEGDLGACDDAAKLIVLSKDQDRREMFKTAWHEWLHGFEAEYRIKLGHRKIRALEEFIVDVLEQLSQKKS